MQWIWETYSSSEKLVNQKWGGSELKRTLKHISRKTYLEEDISAEFRVIPKIQITFQ